MFVQQNLEARSRWTQHHLALSLVQERCRQTGGVQFGQAVRFENAALNKYAHDAGCWPTVANPGADTPGRYFAAEAADVIVIHEGNSWPTEERLKGDDFGGYADYPPFTRGVLVHSQPELDRESLRMVSKHTRWVYVTEAVYRSGDSKDANPWSRLSKHLEAICAQLADK